MFEQTSGWMSTMSWQGAVASGSFLIGTISQGLIAVNRPSYEPQGWQGTLFIVAVALLVMNINLWAAKALPFLQNVLLVLHVFAFTAIVIILWVVARVQPAKTVFTQFANYGGWNSMGLTLMVGQVNAVFAAICAFASHIFIFHSTRHKSIAELLLTEPNLRGNWAIHLCRVLCSLRLAELIKTSQARMPRLICPRRSKTPAWSSHAPW
jgi:hypothetical protein